MAQDPVAAQVEIDEVVTLILGASRMLGTLSEQSLDEGEESLTLTQFRCLAVIARHETMRLNELADVLGVNASTALRTVDKLLTAKLVTRKTNPKDRREVQLALTSAGGELVARTVATRREAVTGVVRRMPVARRRELVRALESLAFAAKDVPVRVDADW